MGLDRHHLTIITRFKLLQICLHPAQATCHTPLSLVMWKKAKYITHNKGTVMQCLGLTHFCWYYRLHGNVMVLTKTSHLHVPCWPETASSYKTDMLDGARHLLWSHHKQYALQNAKNLFNFFCFQDSAKYVILAFIEGFLFSEQGLKQVPKLYTDSQWNVKIYELRWWIIYNIVQTLRHTPH